MPQVVIAAEHIRKVYADTVAVDDVAFEVLEGEIFGLIGPNGAGKTTTMECIEGLRAPDAGSIRVHLGSHRSSLQGRRANRRASHRPPHPGGRLPPADRSLAEGLRCSPGSGS